MKGRIIIGIAVCLIALMIAGLILRPVFVPVGLGGIALIGVWIYLLLVVQKKKAQKTRDLMEPEAAETLLKRLKVLLLISGISLMVGVIGVVLHNAIYGLSENEEPVSFIIAILGLFLFVVVTIISLVGFLLERRKLTQKNA